MRWSLDQIKSKRVSSRLLCATFSLYLHKLALLELFQSEGRNHAGWLPKLLLGALALLGSALSASADDACWINAKTGEPYPLSRLVPVGTSIHEFQADPNHVYIPPGPDIRGGGNLAGNWVKVGGTWINATTGEPYPPSRLVPVGTSIHEFQADPNHVYIPPGPDIPGGGNLAGNWVRVPCPPQAASSSGLYLGGELVKNWGWLRSTEYRAGTDIVTNEFIDRADPIGGGFLIGYRFAPFGNSIVVSPFASFDFMRAPVNHTFANGSFLGTTANFMGTFGVKVGPQFDAFWLYGIAGVSALNQTLNVNFIPVASSQSATVPGGTVGFGGAWRPNFLQGFGRPVSVFAEYQHFWWADANFNTPAASPAFNYTFRRQDDLLKVGFTVDLNPPPPPPVAAPRYPVKAPALK